MHILLSHAHAHTHITYIYHTSTHITHLINTGCGGQRSVPSSHAAHIDFGHKYDLLSHTHAHVRAHTHTQTNTQTHILSTQVAVDTGAFPGAVLLTLFTDGNFVTNIEVRWHKFAYKSMTSQT